MSGHEPQLNEWDVMPANSCNHLWWLSISRLILIVLALWLPASTALGTTIIPRDVKLTLRKVDAATGKEIWHSPEFTDVRPTHLELFRGRLVTYFRYLQPVSREFSSFSHPGQSRVYFFDSETGKEVPAFDTRDFVRTRDDNLLTASRHAYSSMSDERNELYLSNGWKSYGMKRLSWDGVRTIHFFQAGKPIYQDPIGSWEVVWVWTRPEGADDIRAWESNILYCQHRMDGETAVETLVAIRAGAERPIWKFELPRDVPAVLDTSGIWPDEPRMRRSLDYAATKKNIFVYGNGYLFALDPNTGVATRKVEVSSALNLQNPSAIMNRAEVHVADDEHVFIVGSLLEQPNLLVSVTLGATPTVKLVREDLLDARSAIAYGGSIYFFTAEELPESKRRVTPQL